MGTVWALRRDADTKKRPVRALMYLLLLVFYLYTVSKNKQKDMDTKKYNIKLKIVRIKRIPPPCKAKRYLLEPIQQSGSSNNIQVFPVQTFTAEFGLHIFGQYIL